MKIKFSSLLVLVLFSSSVFAQSDLGSIINFRKGVHSGNRVKTVFHNAGTVGFPPNGGPRGAWKYENNGYIGDVSFMVGGEVRMTATTEKDNLKIKALVTANKDSVYHAVVVSDVTGRPTKNREESPSGDIWSFQPKSGYNNPNQSNIAFSDNPSTWPTSWPDKSTDPIDPGWRGYWNGYFGKEPKADQESYYVMDDHSDYEFNNSPFNLVPDSNRPSRKGLGLDVKVRGMQWSQFLAQDCIFWLYDIKNNSTTNYNKAVVGLLAGTLVGVSGTNAYNEYDDDVSFFDVQNSLVYTWDFDNDVSRNPKWVGTEVGYVGYAFLESPGNGYDGIDNDRDSKTAPLFTTTSFDSVLVSNVPGTGKVNKLVVIKENIDPITKNFKREVITVQNTTPFKIKTRGMADSILITPNVTKLAEGNSIAELPNPNAFDGVDNDFDGLIDENYYLHYRQRKTTTKNGITVVLFDILAPTRYVDYINNVGINDLLVDEKRDDGIDNDNDWTAQFDDVGADGVEKTGDVGEDDGIPSPGEPNFDATDVNESDQIGLTSFNYFTPSGAIDLADDELLWKELRPGFFSVPSNFSNGVPINGEDGDFTFGSGYFPLLAQKTEFFSFALVYGKDKTDLYNHRKTVQKIYDSNYRFPQAPTTPTLKIVSGDGKVTLYWDRVAEESIDPVLKTKDFEGYKLYKSRDNNFNDINTITNAYGEPVGYIPLAVYDIPGNNISGIFKPNSDLFEESRGYTYYLGDDVTGLKHSYIDTDVKNSQRYYYALVAFDSGVDSLGIFPSENSKSIIFDNTGAIITFKNTGYADPTSRSSDYSVESTFLMTHTGPGEGAVTNTVLDDSRLKDNVTYEVRFNDSSNDGLDNDNDGIFDQNDPDEIAPVTTSYSVINTNGVTESFNGVGLSSIQLTKFDAYLDSLNLIVKDNSGAIIPSINYKVDGKQGKIKPRKPGFQFDPNMIYTAIFQPYGIYNSIYIKGNPSAKNDASNDVAYDGITYSITNKWDILTVQDSSVFIGGTTAFRMSANRHNASFSGKSIQGLNLPYNYVVEFYDSFVDTSYAGTTGGQARTARAAKFRVKNITLNKYSKFIWFTTAGRYTKHQGKLARTDELIVLEPVSKDYNNINNNKIYYNTDTPLSDGKFYGMTYRLLLLMDNSSADTSITDTNLKWKLVTQKPLSHSDVFSLTSKAGKVDKTKFSNSILTQIQVVPNPYIVYSDFENPPPPGISTGRGERRIEFRRVPSNTKIHIFTASGEHIRTLYDDGNNITGTFKWDLKTKENLDVAAGVYFYIVESPYGKKEGKIAIIK